MLKMKSIISAQVNGNDFDLHCSPQVPIDDALEANNQIGAFLLGRKQQAQQAQNAKPAEEQPKSE